ncbi:HesA/MoeB/ThiF family protein [Parahaliea aestuarii]|uniref:Molybdopterin-synthase adenylyltransferase MoeB n=1 Tax=Parahaliea aestuarii TaxID=1852021 RepID=A0A5C9A2D0_9GAMM|nr:molybdopterin-synthase adenylyltransferase MoeB [Parahaliea aestuarii]TXS94876.1 molybdopterin-synthase adenylyltransferase MoeB [Parahaliea aestuarii]
MLTDDELLRYSRQILVPGFDIAGQEKLQRARVLVLGLGGLGSPAALYLGGAGVGQLLLADGDVVEVDNLPRQLCHRQSDCGRNKAESAAEAIAGRNPGVRIEVIPRHLQATDLDQLLPGLDLVLDCSDNYPVRYALNRASRRHRVPVVSAAAVRTEAQIALLDPNREGPCYRCLYPDAGSDTALSCAESGVLGPVVGVAGSLQALEAIKYLSGCADPLGDTLLVMDLASLAFQRLRIRRRDNCPDCGSRA